MDSNTKYKLYYFEANSKGAAIRAILTYTKADWEDIRVPFSEWPALKQKTEFGLLPVLEVNGQKMSQTIALESYLAKKFGLMGDTDEDEYDIMSLLGVRNDLLDKIYPAFKPMIPEQKANQEANIDELLNTVFPFILTQLEKRIVKSKDKYAQGDKFTLADIIYTVTIYNIFKHPLRKDLLHPILLKNAPNLNNLVEMIRDNELKDYFDNVHLNDKPL